MERTVLITGGSKGIGFATAKQFLSQGDRIIITGRNEEKLKEASEKLGGCPYLVWDIANISLAAEMIEQADAFYNGIDVFVNNAGVVLQWGYGFLEMTEEIWDKTMEINLKGLYFACQAEANYFLAKGRKGHIVNVCSEMGFRAAADPYGISKWGVRGMTLGLAKVLGPQGIVVNAIAPGETATEILRQQEGEVKPLESPRGVQAIPEEMARTIYLLATEDNMIGTILLTDGGRSLH